MPKPRTLLAHIDHTVLDRLARVLAPEFDIVGALDDLALLPDDVRRVGPDVIVQNLSDSPQDALDLVDNIRQMAPNVCLVLVTQAADEQMIASAFERGASAVILQSAADYEFLDAIRAACARRK
jgi:DNA-binding NarL/FixJ family response regulator